MSLINTDMMKRYFDNAVRQAAHKYIEKDIEAFLAERKVGLKTAMLKAALESIEVTVQEHPEGMITIAINQAPICQKSKS